MARKRGRKKTQRRRSKTGFNIVNAAELYMQTAVITRNVMGTNPWTALTGQESFTPETTKSYNARTGQYTQNYGAVQYGYNPSGASVTVPELLGVDKNSTGVPFGQGVDVMRANFMSNMVPMVIQSVGVRAGFAIGKRLMSKQRSFINTKVLKPLGLKSVVSV